jgi:hypothetical protein
VPALALLRAGARVVESGPDGEDLAAGAWQRLETLPDPRSPQGRIYPLACLIAIAVCAFTAAGNDRFTAVGRADGTRVHLLGVTEHGGRLLDHLEVDVKHNETSHFTALLQPPDLDGTVVTSDALHTVRANLDWLTGQKKAHYIAVVKKNQCATRRFGTSPPQARQTRREVCWGRWLTWIRKVKGTRACQETGGRVQVPGAACRGTRAVWRKLDCLNPNLQRQQFTAAGMAPETGARRGRGVLVRPGHPSRGGSDAQRGHSRR